ncbi:hypothetical protein [Psychroserpens sp.]|uniref:hypothetical protein n=1 Tax=Psychroserpens sp. TaxID=2020870 RepID=UPI001B0F22CF|nr:hypothetical protein [Psychroserpens sp.]MBO6607917.1 hypothetical protein [Psychroserpens sp.]MBO6630984.1 hypothetical protein [Psychroserpens sp.]MBO6654956.1 hypothetical protein [Psychroserpens sp.]MBO6682970.1 hypothetical protein [Psychroserpens sp.]MBO6751275.1 hypothetical protein [Psychroserpens sp.]
MKTVFTFLGLFIATITLSFAQEVKGQITMDDIQLKDLKISVTVDSAEEIKEVFKVGDIKELLEEVSTNEDVTFELICNGDKMSNGKLSSLTYKIDGNTNNIKDFLKRVKEIRKGAINYYNNKD